MLIASLVLTGLVACDDWGKDAHILEGTVVEVRPPDEIVVDHEAIKDFMDPMVMPFAVRDPSVVASLQRGDHIVARLIVDESGSHLDAVRVDGHTELPPLVVAPLPLKPGEVLPPFLVTLSPVPDDGVVVGQGQNKPTALSFAYTRCPVPEFCPALVSKMQALQALVGNDVRLVTVTIDPAHDTREVLDAFEVSAGVDRELWRFGRVDDEKKLAELAALAGLNILPDPNAPGQIVHGARLLVLDKDGRLVERYDDNRFPVERVVQQLRTGGPPQPAGTSGTITP